MAYMQTALPDGGSWSRRRCRSTRPSRPMRRAAQPHPLVGAGRRRPVPPAASGCSYVSSRVIEEVAQPLFVLGVLALTVGVGFVVSAGASFLLSRRLGLLDPLGTAARAHRKRAALAEHVHA